MKTFTQYIMEKDVGLGDLSMNMNEPDNNLIDIATLAIRNHSEETINFFKQLASKDGVIKKELQKYFNDRDGNEMHKANPGKREEEKEQIAYNPSDSGMAPEEGDF